MGAGSNYWLPPLLRVGALPHSSGIALFYLSAPEAATPLRDLDLVEEALAVGLAEAGDYERLLRGHGAFGFASSPAQRLREVSSLGCLLNLASRSQLPRRSVTLTRPSLKSTQIGLDTR